MNRRLNYKFLFGLVSALVVLGAGLFGLHALQINRNAGAFLEQAAEAEKQAAEAEKKAAEAGTKAANAETKKDAEAEKKAAEAEKEAAEADKKAAHKRALTAMERYLSYKPKDTAAMIKYATLLAPDPDLANLHDARLAADLFERVILADPAGHDDIRRRAIDLELKYGDGLAAQRNLLYLLGNLADDRSADDDKDDSGKGKYSRDLAAGPKDARLQWQLGKCHQALGKFDLAVEDYKAAIQNDPHLVDAYAQQATVLRTEMGNSAEADKLMDVIDTKDGIVANNRDSFQAYLERARYRTVNLTLPDKALREKLVHEDIEKARSLAPDNADVLLMSAELLLASGAPDLAGVDVRLMPWGDGSGVPTSGKNVIIAGTDANGLPHVRAFDANGNRIIDTDEKQSPAQAAPIVALKRRLPGLLPPHVLTGDEKTQVIRDVASISLHISLGKARNDLENGLKNHPQDLRLYKALARVEIRANTIEKAVEWLRQGIKALGTDPGAIELRWILADLLTQTDKSQKTAKQLADQTQEAGALLDELRKTTIKPQLLTYIEARILVSEQKWFGAAQTLERLAPAMALEPGMGDLAKRSYLMLGQCYEHINRPDMQFNAYRRAMEVVATDPALNVSARFGVAESLVTQEKYTEAVSEYNKLLALPGAPRAEVSLIRARVLVLRNLRQSENKRDWREVEEALNLADSANPNSAQVPLLRADVSVARNRVDEAEQQIKSAIEKHPELVELWVALAAITERQGKLDAALAVLTDAEQHLGPRVEILIARARYWGGRGGPQAKSSLDQMRNGLDQNSKNAFELSDSDRVRLISALASAYSRLGESLQARQLIQTAADAQHNNLDLQLTLFEQDLRDGELDEAEKALDRIHKVDNEASGTGDGTVWRFCRVRLLTQRTINTGTVGPALDEAQQLLREVEAKRPNWPGAMVAQAQIDELLKHEETALTNYQKAIAAGDRSPRVIQRTAELLMKRGRYAQADDVLKNLQGPAGLFSSDMQRLAANVALNTGDYERALNEARRAITADTKDPRELMWFGQILWFASRQADSDGRKEEAKGRLLEAEQILRRAVAAAESAPEPWVVLVRFLVGSEQTAKAQEAVQQAEKQLTPQKNALALAQIYEVVGQADKAGEMYEQAIKTQPNDPVVLRNVTMHTLRKGQTDEAKVYLKKLINLGPSGPSDDVDWAKRTLAVLTAVGGDYRQTLEALNVLGVSDSTKSDQHHTPTILRTQAQILATRPNRGQRRQAIEILEGLVEQQTAQPNDLFLLARLYEIDGSWSKARKTMDDLLKSYPDNASFLAYYITALTKHNDVSGADSTLKKLIEVAPDQPGSLAVQARVLNAKGQTAEAVQKLQAFAQGNRDRLEPVAILLDDLGQTQEAEAIYRELPKKFPDNPAAVLPLIRFLGKHGRTDKALDLLDEQAWAKLPSEVVSNISVGVLYGSNTKMPEQFEHVAARIEKAIKENPTKTSLQFDLANVQSILGKYDEAEKIYRPLTREAKGAGSALNNLAFLLALEGGPTRLREAAELIQKAMGIDGEVPDLLDTRALIYLAQARPEDAMRDLEEAVAIKPTGDKYFHLARAYLMVGRSAEAKESFRKAKEIGLERNGLHPLERAEFDRVEKVVPKE